MSGEGAISLSAYNLYISVFFLDWQLSKQTYEDVSAKDQAAEQVQKQSENLNYGL